MILIFPVHIERQKWPIYDKCYLYISQMLLSNRVFFIQKSDQAFRLKYVFIFVIIKLLCQTCFYNSTLSSMSDFIALSGAFSVLHRSLSQFISASVPYIVFSRLITSNN